MKNNSEFPLIARAQKWLKVKFAELKMCAISVVHLGPFSPLVRIRALQLLIYGSIYPMARIALGRDRASKICEFFIKTPSLIIFPYPNPLKSKLIIKDNKDWSVVTELFINDVYQKNTVTRGMNIIDIGAHIGGHTIYFAEKVGDTGSVIAFEPEPKNYQALLENISLNGFKNVIPIQTALSNHTGLEKLYISPWSTGHSLLPELAEDGNFMQIQATTLDATLEKLSIKKIDLIKIDAEGAELQILNGAKETLKNNPKVKILVASYHYPSEIQEVQDFLHAMGFQTKVSPFDIVMTI